MSSSKVISRFSLEPDPFPIGSEEFVERFQRERQESSPAARQLRRMEEKYRLEAQQAYQNGFVAGEASGLQKGLANARRMETQLTSLVTELVRYRQALYQESKTRLMEFAFAIADKITATRALVEQGTVLDTINRGIAEILDKTRIKIKVNPQQHELVKSRIDELVGSDESITSVVVEADSRVSSGGCIIETDSGSADARLESQMEVLKEKLLALET